ncbi:MAG: phosphoglucomutase/phosphomannomutase family protein [bacterium]|jgi:phosphomannomutase
MSAGVKFGTDGWRGITASDFTFSNVILVAEAIRRHLTAGGAERRVLLIGYDTRFLARNFAHSTAGYLGANGLSVAVADAPIPTPAIAFAVKHLGAAGAIQFTASHNPYYYNGLKFIPDFAGPAMPETTDAITAIIKELTDCGWSGEYSTRVDFGKTFEVRSDYFAHLDELIDANAIKNAGIKVLYNALWATGSGWLDGYLRGRGIEVETMNAERDVLFGGSMPDPSYEILKPMESRLAGNGFSLGLSTDGDSDRFAAFDGRGGFATANKLIPLIAHYLIVERGMPGDLVRTVSTSALLDRIAAAHGRGLIETKVGFKYVGHEIRGGALCGGEESGGFSMAGHVPEKDGILACLLACEIAAVLGGGSLSRCFEIIEETYGPSVTKRTDLHLTEEGKAAVLEQAKSLADHYAERGGELWGIPVVKVVSIDGYKFMLAGDRSILVRASGTEPVVRIYLEARTEAELEELDEQITRFIELTIKN